MLTGLQFRYPEKTNVSVMNFFKNSYSCQPAIWYDALKNSFVFGINVCLSFQLGNLNMLGGQ
jgi:hypothetical protein